MPWRLALISAEGVIAMTGIYNVIKKVITPCVWFLFAGVEDRSRTGDLRNHNPAL